jgi:hypothetical protein
MEATEALYLLRQLGLSLESSNGRLIVSPAELIDDDVRWLIRKHRDAIILELERAGAPRWAWLIRFGGYALETYHNPEASLSEVLQRYPDAISVMPMPHKPTTPSDN